MAVSLVFSSPMRLVVWLSFHVFHEIDGKNKPWFSLLLPDEQFIPGESFSIMRSYFKEVFHFFFMLISFHLYDFYFGNSQTFSILMILFDWIPMEILINYWPLVQVFSDYSMKAIL